MCRLRVPLYVGLALSLALVFSPRFAFASLGGDVTSIGVDRAQAKAQNRGSTQGPGYSVQQYQLPSGTLVREYLSADGEVFAVSWQGRSVPNLQALLGQYFKPYVAAAAAAHHNHHHLTVNQPDLVVETEGHARAFSGRAYVPSLLPPDFSPIDIQ